MDNVDVSITDGPERIYASDYVHHEYSVCTSDYCRELITTIIWCLSLITK